jgi:hypothetical protein
MTPSWIELKATLERHLSVAVEKNLFGEEIIVRMCEAFSNAKVSDSEEEFRAFLSSLERALADARQIEVPLKILDRLSSR